MSRGVTYYKRITEIQKSSVSLCFVFCISIKPISLFFIHIIDTVTLSVSDRLTLQYSSHCLGEPWFPQGRIPWKSRFWPFQDTFGPDQTVESVSHLLYLFPTITVKSLVPSYLRNLFFIQPLFCLYRWQSSLTWTPYSKNIN